MSIENTHESAPQAPKPEQVPYAPGTIPAAQKEAMYRDEAASQAEAESLLAVVPKPKYEVGKTWGGLASFYGPGDYGKLTSSGRPLIKGQLIAAHRGLPNGTFVEVTNANAPSKKVVVEIIDNGPAILSREIDLSEAAFERIGDKSTGVLSTKIKILSLPQRYLDKVRQQRGA